MKYSKSMERIFILNYQSKELTQGGVEITGKAINELIGHSATKSIKIIWKRDEIKLYDPYDKWIELWKDDVIWTSKLST